MGAPWPDAGATIRTPTLTKGFQITPKTGNFGRSSRSPIRRCRKCTTQPGRRRPLIALCAPSLGQQSQARRGRRQADADSPGHLRPDRPAADAGGDRRLSQGRCRRTPSPRWSIGCWRRRTTANAGPPLARRGPLRRGPGPHVPGPALSATATATAIGSSRRSTTTCPTTASSRSRSPATCSTARIAATTCRPSASSPWGRSTTAIRRSSTNTTTASTR